MKRSREELKRISELTFYSNDLDQKLTIADWLKELLKTLLYEQEGFSGKRPFGNSSWTCDVDAILIKEKVVTGELDKNSYPVEVDSDDVMSVLNGIVDAFVI